MDEAQQETLEELARQAAELATGWVSADAPLTESQGWALVGLQYAGSAQGEMYVWGRVGAWEKALAEVLATGDGTEESRRRIEEARERATGDMRDMLLRAIPKGDPADGGSWYGRLPDPGEALRRFIASHGPARSG
ncbi:hypothetical protein [Streptomyces sp. NPDC048603]|uniref:hypothetical protein n=1 Tax=Streptomyces sp. NPDC048603 TaxID=3365577 RepID=UPI003723CF35